LRKLIALVLALPALAACAARAPVASPAAPFPLHEDWRLGAGSPAPLPTHANLASDGQTVFLATAPGTITALDIGTGTERFHVAAEGIPSVADGLLVVRHRDGPVAAFGAADGTALWTAKTGIAGDTPAQITSGRVVLVGRGAAVLDARTGERVWSARGLGHFTTAPAVAAGVIVAGTQEGSIQCLDFATGKLLWSYTAKGPLRAAPVADGEGAVVLGGPDGRIVSLRLATGRRAWRWRVGTDTTQPGSVCANAVCVAAQDAVLYVLKRGNGSLLWRAPLPSRPLSPPIVYGDTLFVACYGRRENLSTFVAIDARTGKRQGTFDIAGELATAPVFSEGRFVAALRSGVVVGFSLAPLAPTGTPSPSAAGAAPAPAASPRSSPTPAQP
jgi:outer membrane protein assembly factor BamB